jgi:biotin-(acetyl-CoA carboxylase) ligase
LITGHEHSVADIRVRLAFAFFFWLERLKKNGGIEIVIQADKHSRPLLGQLLMVHIGRRTVQGKFVGLDSTGGLILENSAGSREIFASGEILLE